MIREDWVKRGSQGGQSDLQLEAPEHPQSPFMMMVDNMSWSFDVGSGSFEFGGIEVDLEVLAWS